MAVETERNGPAEEPDNEGLFNAIKAFLNKDVLTTPKTETIEPTTADDNRYEGACY